MEGEEGTFRTVAERLALGLPAELLESQTALATRHGESLGLQAAQEAQADVGQPILQSSTEMQTLGCEEFCPHVANCAELNGDVREECGGCKRGHGSRGCHPGAADFPGGGEHDRVIGEWAVNLLTGAPCNTRAGRDRHRCPQVRPSRAKSRLERTVSQLTQQLTYPMW